MERILNDKLNINENEELSLRPITLDDYVGQHAIKENLKVFIEAAKMREESLDHVLLYGPPGLGKTTLAFIIANELGVNFGRKATAEENGAVGGEITKRLIAQAKQNLMK